MILAWYMSGTLISCKLEKVGPAPCCEIYPLSSLDECSWMVLGHVGCKFQPRNGLEREKKNKLVFTIQVGDFTSLMMQHGQDLWFYSGVGKPPN